MPLSPASNQIHFWIKFFLCNFTPTFGTSINNALPKTASYTEYELTTLLKQKDEQAFNFLYDNYSAALYGAILKTVADVGTAQDTLQNVFIKIWKSFDRFDSSKGSLYTWMLNIARNTAIDVLRSSAFQQNQKTKNIEDNVYKDTQELMTNISVDGIGLQKVITKLKEEYRVIIELAYFKGYTQEDIAKELNIPVGTVKTRCRNALLQLKEIVK